MYIYKNVKRPALHFFQNDIREGGVQFMCEDRGLEKEYNSGCIDLRGVEGSMVVDIGLEKAGKWS